MLDGTKEQISSYINKNSAAHTSIAIIAYEDDAEYISAAVPNIDIYKFGLRGDEISQAHLLFKVLRDTDKKRYDVIYAPLPSTEGIGLALYNRMIRAAAHNIIRL